MCCGDTEAKVRMVHIFRSEAEHISKETSMNLEEFVDKIDGFAPYLYQIKKTSNRKCVFFKDNLCSIYKHRPLICRFYPFQLRNLRHNKYVFSYTNECPNIGKGTHLERRYYERLFTKFIKLMKEEELYPK